MPYSKKTVEFGKSWPTNGWIPPTAPRTTMATIPAVPTSGSWVGLITKFTNLQSTYIGMVEEYRSSIFGEKPQIEIHLFYL